MAVLTGLDVLRRSGFSELKGKRIGVVCNQASIASDDRHILDLMLESGLEIGAVFGPQHGLWGHTQDNMIEWEGSMDLKTGLRVYSLYGEHRRPTPAMLNGVDELIFDIPEVGARYYTFIWTLFLCMEACSELQIPVTVFDRPNPLGGVQREGLLTEPGFESFVGLKPLPMRHGMTMGEIALYFQSQYLSTCHLKVVQMEGWERRMLFGDTGLPWAMPSPNMPTPETAMVYPGMCLFEGTKLSEGRGTTRPFETFGAPFIDGRDLAARLNALELPGVRFRPVCFQPTFQKWAGAFCEGCFIHVLDAGGFRAVLTAAAILRQIRLDYGALMEWQVPPYEYEFEKLPIDILSGSTWFREAIDDGRSLDDIAGAVEFPDFSFNPIYLS